MSDEYSTILSILAILLSGLATYFAAQAKFGLDRTAIVIGKIHALNTTMAEQLSQNAITTRRLADVTGDPVDEVIADHAEKLDKDHAKKQEQIDADKLRDTITGQ